MVGFRTVFLFYLLSLDMLLRVVSTSTPGTDSTTPSPTSSTTKQIPETTHSTQGTTIKMEKTLGTSFVVSTSKQDPTTSDNTPTSQATTTTETSSASKTTTKYLDSSTSSASPATSEGSESTQAPNPDSTTGAPSSDTTTGAPSSHTTTGAPSSHTTTGAPNSDTTSGASSSHTTTGTPNSDTTTGAPSSDTTTGSPSSHTTTGAPNSHTTTGAPNSDTTSGASSSHTTTGAPNSDTTTGAPSSHTTTGAPSSHTTTGAPNSDTTTVAKPTTQPPKTTPQNPCSPGVCSLGSVCVPLFMNYTCQCIPGYYYESNGCVQAKTFPGELHLKSINFTESMSDKSSKEFQITSSQIEAELNSILKHEKGYIKSVVLKLAPGSVLASVDNFYDLNSNVTAETISNAIRKQTETCDDTNTCKLIDKETTYSNENLCAQHNSCDLSTTTCSYTIGILSCPCKNGYLPSSFSPHVCVACASGYKVENNKCVACPFGRAGLNCDDSSLLAVVVISCVLGGLLCIVILALLILCCSLKRSSSYSSPYPPEDFLMWPKQEVPRIPRATTTCEATQLEMSENGSTHNLVKKQDNGTVAYDNIDELKTFRGKNQSRYSYLCHGQENPYFVPDEDKRT